MPESIEAINKGDSFGKSIYLQNLEQQMKKIWGRYVERLDSFGLDEEAHSLRREYFRLYGDYKMNKKWADVVNAKIDWRWTDPTKAA